MKKFLALLVTGVLALSLFGCTEPKDGLDSIPEYTEDKTFMIGGWSEPPATNKAYSYIKEAGLDFIFLGQTYAGMGSEKYFELLDYMNEIGLKAMLQTGSGQANQGVFDQETDYSKYPAVYGLNYWDEPFFAQLDAVRELGQWHKQKYGNTDVKFYINMNPFYDKLGGDYNEYVESVSDIIDEVGGVKTLSVDIYPLLTDIDGSSVSQSWLSNLEDVAIAARDHEMDIFHTFILSVKHLSYRETSEKDFRYQLWVSMAYGCNSASYFIYAGRANNGWGTSLVDVSGEPELAYYDAQKVNAEIHAIDDIYMSFDWEGVYPVTGSETDEYSLFDGESVYYMNLEHSLESLDKISSVIATQDTLVGQFHDKDGNKGYVVTNFSDPYDELDDKVVLNFKDVNRAIVCRGGERKVYQVENNKLELDLGAGEGAFVIPFWLN